jgi:hypothetical protein
MTNTLLGLNASVYQLGELLAILAQFQILWGFLAGFGMAVLMYAFLASAPAVSATVPHQTGVHRSVVAEIVVALMLLVLLLFMVLAVISTLRF